MDLIRHARRVVVTPQLTCLPSSHQLQRNSRLAGKKTTSSYRRDKPLGLS